MSHNKKAMKLSFDPKFFWRTPNASFLPPMPHGLTKHKYMIYSNLEFNLCEFKIRMLWWIIKNGHKISHPYMHGLCILSLLFFPLKWKLALHSLNLDLARQLALANVALANVMQDEAWKVLVRCWGLPSLAAANPSSAVEHAETCNLSQ